MHLKRYTACIYVLTVCVDAFYPYQLGTSPSVEPNIRPSTSLNQNVASNEPVNGGRNAVKVAIKRRAVSVGPNYQIDNMDSDFDASEFKISSRPLPLLAHPSRGTTTIVS